VVININEIHTTIRRQLKLRSLDPDNNKINVMVMYSGGADSLSLAKNLLECTDFSLYLHHVVMKNFEQRDEFQWNVLEDQMRFLKEKTREFEFIHSTTNMQIGLEGKFVGLDSTTALFMGARSCLALKNKISAVYTGHLLATRDVDMFEGITVFNAMFANRRFKPNWLCPFRSLKRDTAKAKIYQSLGPEGLDLTVSCRKPKKINEKYTSCNKCHACKTRRSTLQELGWDLKLIK